jgi:quinol monooxygenase YgiN
MPPLPWRTFRSIDPDTTYVVTITRLPLRSHRRIPRIMLATLRIVRQLRRSEGLVGYALKAELVRKTFWTMSAWADDEALRAFVRSDAHVHAMAALSPHMDGAHIETFTLSGSELPLEWSTVADRLVAV